MRLRVFVYGTLRRRDHEQPGQDLMSSFDPSARMLGAAGGWLVEGYDLYSEFDGIPAVMATPKAEVGITQLGQVVGDVFNVSMAGFRALLNYESFPRSYDFVEVTVRERFDRSNTVEAVMFTHDMADTFGPRRPLGDYLQIPRPATREEVKV